MNIFTVTMTPINPPHDDAVKNMVLDIARRRREHDFVFVSSLFNGMFPGEKNVFFARSPFQRVGRHSMTFLQELYVLVLMLMRMKKTDIFQFFVTPGKFSSLVLKGLLKSKRSVQALSSIHTLRRKSEASDVKDLFFADRVVVYSDFSRKELGNLGVKNVTRIYPGVDMSRFASVRRADGEAVVVYPASYGVLDSSYSFDGFLRLAAETAREIPSVKFIMAARTRKKKDARLGAEFSKKVEEAGLADRFSFMDTVNDMPALFAESAVILMPAARPSAGILEIPLVLLEGAASAKCVIYGDIPPLDELRDKNIGIMVKGSDPSAYSRVIVEMLKNRQRAAEIGAISRKAVERYFSADAMAEEFGRLYKELWKT